MKKKYIIVPAAAFAILFVHAFFGQLIFNFETEQEINKYSKYIHLQPEWNSYPRNILFDVTTVWSNQNPNVNDPFYEHGIAVTLKTEYNQNELQYVNGKPFVELNHEYSECEYQWKPIAYRHAIDSAIHQFDNLAGIQQNSDPYIVQYTLQKNLAYDDSKQQSKLKSGYSHFIPICTSKESSSYDYNVKINDDSVGFDVYFVPSIKQQENFHQNSDFDFYDGCFGKNYQRFSGTCSKVGQNSGLLIVIPDDLNPPLTEITVYLHERKEF